jgi:hypothetical protein
LIAYTLAKQGQYDELAFFVEDFFGAPKIPTTSVSDYKKSS